MQGFNNSLVPFHHKFKKKQNKNHRPDLGQFVVSDFLKVHRPVSSQYCGRKFPNIKVHCE